MIRPTPGSRGAIEMGCTCPVLDNCRGVGFGDPPQFWVAEECKIHGKRKESNEVSKSKEA